MGALDKLFDIVLAIGTPQMRAKIGCHLIKQSYVIQCGLWNQNQQHYPYRGPK